MAAAPNDLTTLEALKAYSPSLAPARAGEEDVFDVELQRLITASSTKFQREVDRDIKQATYTETRNGNGKARLTLKQYPVTSVTSVTIGGATIPPRSAPGTSGWVLLEDAVHLEGYSFTEGVANVVVVYQAGYSAIPFDIEQAVIKDALLQFADRKRIGVTSTSQGGESVSFNDGNVLGYWNRVVSMYRSRGV